VHKFAQWLHNYAMAVKRPRAREGRCAARHDRRLAAAGRYFGGTGRKIRHASLGCSIAHTGAVIPF